MVGQFMAVVADCIVKAPHQVYPANQIGAAGLKTFAFSLMNLTGTLTSSAIGPAHIKALLTVKCMAPRHNPTSFPLAPHCPCPPVQLASTQA